MRAFDALNLLPLPNRLDLRETLGLHGDELAHWDRVSRRMFVPFHDGVISQFEGYGDLAELDWDSYRQRYGNIQRLDRILEAENHDVNRYKASKQADALMLLYLMSSNELRELLADVDFTSIQMFPDAPGAMTHRMNCGNIAAGVPVFALMKNMVPDVNNGLNTIRVSATNTKATRDVQGADLLRELARLAAHRRAVEHPVGEQRCQFVCRATPRPPSSVSALGSELIRANASA